MSLLFDCNSFQIFIGPPVLECTDPPIQVPPTGIANLDIGCDICVERGQSVILLTLDCTPDTRRHPTICTIRNPDGIPAKSLDDGMAFISLNNLIIINEEVRNPENPVPPKVLGVWTCTCVNADGASTADSKIDSCCELFVII